MFRTDIVGVAPGVVRAVIAGELDITNSHIVLTRLLAAVRDRHPAVLDVDVADVTFMDCSTVHALRRVHVTAERSGCRMSIVHPQPIVVRILEILGLLDLFTTGSAVTRTTVGASAL